MIPKVIHYCWFGGHSLPELSLKCIESWKKFCPDYAIKEWNESNFNINCNQYVKEAYEARKFAFVTDYVRLYALYSEGGIYMDTDVEVIKNIDCFLSHVAFSGFEDNVSVPTGIMASEKGRKWAKDNLDYYNNKPFLKSNGDCDLTTNVTIITSYMKKYGIQLDNTFQDFPSLITLYPKDYFCPKSHYSGEIVLTDNSYAIHHFAGSWGNKNLKYKFIKKTHWIICKIFGENGHNRIILVIRRIKSTLI